MKPGIVYLKTRGRMPLQRILPVYLRDTQQDLPVAWCRMCCRELYRSDKELCRRCEGVTDDEAKRKKSLQQMHPGTQSRELRK